MVEAPVALPSTLPLTLAVPHTCFASVTLAQGEGEAAPEPVADAGAASAGAGSALPGSLDAGFRDDDDDPRPPAPRLLSESGCFADTATGQLAPEMIPYVIRSPLWTDGAHKARYFTVSEGSRIEVRPDGSWLWPLGTVMLKNFAFEFVADEGTVVRNVETRIFKKMSNGRWRYWSYEWNAQGTDASLLDDGKQVVLDIAGDNGPLPYIFPGEMTCQACHGFTSEGVLGPNAAQLDLQVQLQSGARRQLELLAELGVVDAQMASPTGTGLVDPANETAPIEARARSYLDGNCAHCHRPDGYAPPDVLMDLRISTPLSEAELCGAPSNFPSDRATLRIAPGEPENSDLWLRFTSDGLTRMPMVGTWMHDPTGEAVIKEWIESLQSCP